MVIAALFLIVALPVHAQIASDSLDEKLFQGVSNNDLPGVQASLAAGADIFAKNTYGQTAADLAVDKGFFDIAHYLTQYIDRVQKSAPAQKALPQMAAPVSPVSVEPLAALSPAAVTPPHPPSITPMVAPPPSPIQDEGPFALSTPPQSGLAMVEDSKLSPSSPPEQNLPATNNNPIPPQPIAAASTTPAEAPQPPETPSKAPSKAEGDIGAPGRMDNLVNAVANFFSPDKPEPAEAELPPVNENKIEAKPETKAETKAETETETKAEPEAESRIEPQNKNTKVVFAPTPAPPPSEKPLPFEKKASAHKISHQNLNGALKLPLGKTLSEQLSQTPDICITKAKEKAVCIEQTDWSEGLFSHFDQLKTSIFKRFDKGNRAVVGYRDGAAKFVQTIFAASDFTSVSDHFIKVYGEPDERTERTAAPLGKPREVNLVLSWYGYDETAKRETVLQIINYDETRSNFVNMEEGVVILKYHDEPSPFTYVTAIELIRIP